MTSPRPGWYPDPAGAPQTYRWWDGGDWTDWLSSSAGAPPPADDEPAPLRRRSAAQRTVALVLVVALFAAAGAGAALWIWRDAGNATGTRTKAVHSPTVSGASASVAGPAGQLDEPSRTAAIGSASMLLPEDPYAVHPDPKTLSGLLDVAFLAEAEVHDSYDGNSDWSAMVALSSLNATLADGTDLEHTAEVTVRRLATRIYGPRPTRVTSLSVADSAVDGHPGVLLTARVHYAIARLPSRYDVVTAQLVRLDDGTVVAALSSVPDDASAKVAAQARAAIDSLTVS